MFKKLLLGFIVTFTLTSNIIAKDESKSGMELLVADLSEAQMNFFKNDIKASLAAILKLQKNIKNIIGNKERVKELLPIELQYKVSTARNSAVMIKHSINTIISALKDKNMRIQNRQRRTQRAFLEIQSQCFRCHNLFHK